MEPNACLEPKHKIFLSHSGAQKDFIRHLSEALKNAHHSPFFDADPKSLPSGKRWLPILKEAAEKCRVAVLVLSDEFFTRSKWPMLEVNMFVKAQNSNLTILPLFYKISFKQFVKAKKQRKWIGIWKKFCAEDSKIDVNEWEQALSKIKAYQPISLGDEGEPAFIRKVVDAICKLVKPDVKFYVPDNQAMGHLCAPVLQKWAAVAPSPKDKVCVMGLYGMGGIGKTTISRAICNVKFEDFGGKVCYIEFGSNVETELQKTVLKELTEVDLTRLDSHHDKLFYLLEKHLKKQKVCLVLDNVRGDDVEEVLMYLNCGYMDGSMVLVTSRSRDILVQQLHIRQYDCLEMPELDERSAINVFRYHIGLNNMECDKENGIVKRYVNKCCFEKQGIVDSNYGKNSEKHYLPLALKVLGSQLQRITCDVEGLEKYWEKFMERLNVERFHLFKEEEHPIFSILRLGYDALREEDRHIFLDLALLWMPQWRSRSFELGYMWEWMCIIHRKSKDGMIESVNALKRNALLDTIVEHAELKCIIHDLYIDLAEEEARAGPFENRRFLLSNKGIGVPPELLKYPSGPCWASLERLIIRNSEAHSLKKAKLNLCSNVEVLQLHGCEELVEVDVGGLENLRSMEVVACNKVGQSTHGVEKLSNLVFFHLADCGGPFVPQFLEILSSLSALMVLNLEAVRIIVLPNLSNLTQLRATTITNCKKLISLGGIIGTQTLQKLNVSSCISLKELPSDLSGLKQLEKLNVSDCYDMEKLGGIGALGTLQELDARRCMNLKELPSDLSGLKHLEKLDVSDCDELEKLEGIGALGALRELHGCSCKNLKEVFCGLSGLRHVEKLDVNYCDELENLEGIGALGSLQELDASWCKKLK